MPRPTPVNRSALELELHAWLADLRRLFTERDRGVVIGLLVGLLPLFPMPFFGLALALFHFRAHRKGRISDADAALVRRSFALSLFNCLLSVLIVWAICHVVVGVDWSATLAALSCLLNETLGALRGANTLPHGAQPV